jgi:hypothetical protein
VLLLVLLMQLVFFELHVFAAVAWPLWLVWLPLMIGLPLWSGWTWLKVWAVYATTEEEDASV